MIATINRGLGSFEPLGHDRVFLASDLLRPEQKCAIESVLKSRDRAVSISGAAGTGKTATLKELRRALCEAGHEVLAVAPTMSAVEELQKVGFANTVTLERLLQDRNMSEGSTNPSPFWTKPEWFQHDKWPISFVSRKRAHYGLFSAAIRNRPRASRLATRCEFWRKSQS